MAAILSHPFRLAGDGAVATVEDGTEVADAEQLAVLVLTRPRERALVPGFGVPDLAFTELNTAAINAGAAVYGPPVTVTLVDVARPDDQTVTATLRFSPQ